MKNNIITKLTAIILCLMMLIPFVSFEVFAEELSDSSAEEVTEDSGTEESSTDDEDEDVWSRLKPAYMTTSFQSIDDRINGNSIIAPMECALVKDGFAMYADEITGEVVWLQLSAPDENGEYEIKENGVYKYDGYFTTNPFNIGTSQSGSGTATTESIKERLYSQVIVEYTENENVYDFNSFTDAALNNQLKVKRIRNGIRVEYTLGREQVEYLVPRIIRKEKLDILIEQIDRNSEIKRDARQFKAFYQLKDPNDTRQAKKTIEEMKEAFPISEQFPIYVCEPHIMARELLRLEKYVRLYTDYSFEQLEIDHAETDYFSADKVPPLFKLALEYTLDELGMSVRCNAGNIRFDSSSYKLSNVVLLPFAGAANVNNDGYVFSPDGSGSLINFEDIRGTEFKTVGSLYGQDYAFHTITGANKEIMRLPVFGMVEIVKDQYTTEEEVTEIDPETGEEITKIEKVKHDLKIGYMSVIETGDSLAKITVENGGSKHMFSSVYTSFNPRPKDSYVINDGLSVNESNAMWTVESKRKYTGDYRLRYFILTEDISYSEMANKYRNYLIEKEAIKKLEKTEDDIPLYIETLGALEVLRPILGVPVLKKIDLTSFESTIKMLKRFRDKADITNIKLKLSGWANEGLVPLVPNGVKVEKVLGGEEGFYSLIEYAKQNNITIYPDFDFVYAANEKAFDGFSFNNDLTKTIDERAAWKKAYDPITQSYQYVGLAVITPNVMDKFYTNTYEEYKKFNVGAISAFTLGESLSSDFNQDDPLHREDSKTLVSKLLEKMQQDNGKIMVSGGNAYVLPYVSDILNLPLDDSRYKYSSASIPFMGMVLHGYKSYSGSAINLAGDYKYTLLKTIESGASPYFIIATDNTSELKDWNHYLLNDYYSIRYNIWLQDMVDTYRKLNNALKDLMYSDIVNHEFLDDNKKIVKVTYDNGTSFIMNYLLNDYTVMIDDEPVLIGDKPLVIPAEDFIKIDKDGNIVQLDQEEGENE